MTFISGAALDFGVARTKGNVRFGNVARVPALVLTHLGQSADSPPAGSECFITDPACAGLRAAGIEFPVCSKVRPVRKL